MDGDEAAAPSLLFSQVHFLIVQSEGLKLPEAQAVSMATHPDTTRTNFNSWPKHWLRTEHNNVLS